MANEPHLGMGEPQLWRGNLWQLQQLLDNLTIWLPRGYLRITYINLSGSLKIETDDDFVTVLKDDFVWVRNGRLESGDIDEIAEARKQGKEPRKW